MTFQILALPEDLFAGYFAWDEDRLASIGARKEVVTEYPGTPCRVSLEDARPGETVLLANYTHQSADTPYYASHAIYIREGQAQRTPAPGDVPELMLRRPISIRGFSTEHYMLDARIAEGAAVKREIDALFDNAGIAYLHLHYAAPGCFAAEVVRVQCADE